MKKFFMIFVLSLILFTCHSNSVFAGGLNFASIDTDRILKDEIQRQIRLREERQRREEERRQKERDERIRQKIEEERNQSRIRQEQSRREALARQEQLKDIYHQERIEVAQEHVEDARIIRQKNRHPQTENAPEQSVSIPTPDMQGVGEARINPGDILLVIHIYPDKTCQIEGEKMIFNNAKELKDYTDFAYPGKTVRVKIIKR